MKTYLLRASFAPFAVAFLVVNAATPPGRAAEKFWNNTSGGNFSTGGNWSPSGSPGTSDNAHFSNNVASYTVNIGGGGAVNANGYFNANGGIVSLTLGADGWTLTNSFVVGQVVGSTAAVSVVNGNLFVTNTAGTGRLVVGQDGKGTLNINGGSVVTDLLLVTNNGPGFTNSILNFNLGSLTTLKGSTIVGASNQFVIGASNNQTASWVMRGGTNVILLPGSGETILGAVTGARGNVTVTGSGTFWSNSGALRLGVNGSNNVLVISNGATVVNTDGRIGGTATSTGNVAAVNGANSRWLNSGFLSVGDGAGRGNRLEISAGGFVSSPQGGRIGSAIDSSNNVALVTGTGSVWSNGVGLSVGLLGSSNALLASNGGSVLAPTIVVGDGASAMRNVLSVSGGNLAGTDANGTELIIGRDGQGTLDFNGGSITASRLFVTNNGAGFTNSVLNFNYGNLTTLNGSAITQATNFIIGNTPGQTATWLMAGGTNTIELTSGGNTVLGRAAGSSGAVTVTGAGTLWSNSSTLIVGSNSPSNLLVVSNGGKVVSYNGYVGAAAGSSNNQVIVTGSNSLWTTANELRLGFYGAGNGAGNVLRVSDGGTVWALDRFVVTQSNNLVIVNNGVLFGLSISLGGSQNSMFVTNGGVVSGFYGYLDGFGGGNYVHVSGSNSIWRGTESLYIGDSSANNTVLVNDGGRLLSRMSFIGYDADASNNRVVLTGNGSQWTNTDGFYVGLNGSSNQLVISNGAQVFSGNYTDIGNASGSVHNSAIVTGSNSAWRVNGNLATGSSGASNRLTISDGGQVTTSNDGFIGVFSAGNRVVVTGTNSAWAVGASLYAGYFAGDNSLVVSNGGRVSVGSTAFLGFDAASSNNRLTTSGGSLLVTNAAGTAVLDIRRGTNVLNAGRIEADSLVLTNTSGFFDFNGGTLITRGATISNGRPFVVGRDAGFAPATWDVRSNTLPTTIGGTLFIGSNSSFGTLLITNGAQLVNAASYIGSTANADSNTALVRGSNSVWNTTGDLQVGVAGFGNQLLVADGATSLAASTQVGGFGGSNNSVLVTGTGTVLSNSTYLTIGTNSYASLLVVSNGGHAYSKLGVVGGGGSLFGANRAVITGFGSSWQVGSNLVIGSGAPSNRLEIRDAAQVLAGFSSLLGDGSTSDGNTALVTGARTLWSNANRFVVGLNGSDNRLVISNGATVFAGFQSDIGFFSVSSNNEAVVTGVGSLWSNSVGSLIVGNSGRGNRLIIKNGGRIDSANAIIGAGASANSNLVFVTGSGSVWNAGSRLYVGVTNAGNTLRIEDGGLVNDLNGVLGVSEFSSNHTAIVAGPGSLWSNRSGLFVGSNGVGNLLIISNGGTVFASNNIYLGFNPATASNNRIVVQGGTLRAQNAAGTGTLDIRTGTNVLNSGLIEADRLLVTNSAGFFTFNGGTLNVRSATVNNGAPFIVGNGTSSANYHMSGVATNLHSIGSGLFIASNATLSGNGTILSSVINSGLIAPGSSAGSIHITTSLYLTGSSMISFELGGLIATNDYDVLNIASFVDFAGTLSLSLLNNFLPDDSDTFALVSFGAATGNFANISGGRVSLTNNLASFAVTQTATNLVLGGITYTDTDGDGQGDLQEAAAGTDPNSSASYLGITSITQNGSGHNVITFQSVPAKTYRIEYSNNLLAWPTATTNVPSAGTSTQWIDDGTLTGGLPTGQRFYRVGLQ